MASLGSGFRSIGSAIDFQANADKAQQRLELAQARDQRNREKLELAQAREERMQEKLRLQAEKNESVRDALRGVDQAAKNVNLMYDMWNNMVLEVQALERRVSALEQENAQMKYEQYRASATAPSNAGVMNQEYFNSMF